MILPIVAGIIALSVLVLVHELGHYISAKAFGVKVEEFALGMGPRIWGRKWGETTYAINWIPFGGYNKIAGEVDHGVPDGLASRGKGVRLLVLAGGSIMNFILPFLLFIIIYMIPYDQVMEPILVKDVAGGSPAAVAGFEAGDTILSIDGKTMNSTSDLQRYIQRNLGEEIVILVEHSDGVTEDLEVVPRWNPPEGQGAIGIELDIETAALNRTVIKQYNLPWEAVPLGISACFETFGLYARSIVVSVMGEVPVSMTGPVGIVQLTGEVAAAGISPFLEITAVISIALGMTQLLPLPALDGGHIVFVLLEIVRRGKRVSPKVEALVHTIGMLLLFALLIALTYQDIVRIITGESLIG